ncbi:T9SS type A sorting domain-containing protein [Chryseobacterium jejuense]|uniref:Por secretion system C-terminal sorting domain n=1 Tax=Chryseobacterium jejuense TaxID=445960 RepID=A0A2X2X5N3_CHRJE|nr:T9SS type A sorting domain-containing protein [Chryseobacterium jejuense]SDJ40727.1 Por secretion system C-terminal sorting domain-containing protein [Chryseobacterium jejuense]SQB45961.1 Por secretion system C-terminal sorting domain [Chryseobacterium jejuense]
MKKIYILLSMLPVGLCAQNFTEIQTGMNNFYFSAADIADVDNNGTLDIVVNGAIDSDGDGSPDATYNEVYRNNGTTLQPYTDLGGDVTHLGDIRFIDFNNDGLMDIISTGLSYMDIVNYKHYRFKNTGVGFVREDELPGKIYGSLEVFDFNHDGKQDYAINGTQFAHGGGFRNTVDFYQNTGPGFTMTENWVDGTQNGSFKVVDLNNDHLLDLVIIGSDINGDPVSKVYINKNGTLVHTQALDSLISGKLEVADFNADGFQDIVVMGKDANDDPYLAVLMNDGTGNLVVQQMPSEISDASISVGDLNNDGYYDFIVSGDVNYNAVVKTYLYNTSTQKFTEGTTTGLHSLGGPGMIQLFDFNNDNHLDVLLGGFDWANPDIPSLTKVFKNNSTDQNAKPTAPTHLNMTKNGNRFNFTWSGATDDKTPANALRYEIKVGSTPNSQDIAKYIVTTPSWFLDLDPSIQNVYWSVRSIDASKVYSEASTQGSLSTRENTVNHEKELVIYPNPTSDKVYIKGEKVSEAEIYSMEGRKLNVTLKADQSIDVSHLPKGVYLLKLKIKNEITTKKLSIK